MFIGMADPTCSNSNQNVRRTDFRIRNFDMLQRFSDLSESHRAHSRQRYSRIECTLESKSACTCPSFCTGFLKLNSNELASISSLLRRAREKLQVVQVNRN